MASLYEINEAIMACVDYETGEIIDADALDTLLMQREEKLESIALWVKNLMSDVAAYKAEKEAFAEREKKALAKADSLKRYLTTALEGQKFSTSKCAVSFRKSESVDVQNVEIIPVEFVTRTETIKPDKAAIKAAIKAGQDVSGCRIVENVNIAIK